MKTVSSEKNYKTTLPAHDVKRQLMAPGGRFMAENDKSCRRQVCLCSGELRRTGRSRLFG